MTPSGRETERVLGADLREAASQASSVGEVSAEGDSESAFDATGISKAFDEVQALRDVNFSVRTGEVHALIGENGAGKTTLANILTGLYRPDAGRISIDGEEVEIHSPRDSIKRGMGMVHQHFEVVEALTAFENIVLGVQRKWWTLDRDRHKTKIRELAARYDFEVNLDRRVADLDIGHKQKIAILRVLYGGARVLVLDEPTTHLAPGEVDRLFDGIRRLAADGVTVVLIAHKLAEVLAIADRITVLRAGRVVGTLEEAKDEATIIRMMMGEKGIPKPPPTAVDEFEDRTALAVEDAASLSSGQFAVSIANLSFAVKVGEIIGIAGVAGNGQRELVELLVGVRSLQRGRIFLNGQEVSRASVADRIRAGLAVIPSDRLGEGLLPNAPLFESYALGLYAVWRGERWAMEKLRQRAREVIDKLTIAAPNEEVPTAFLSGGNLQKLLVGRVLAIASASASGTLVAMNPTSGLDVSATAFVRNQLVGIAQQRKAVIIISEDLDELFQLCRRILVIHAGRLVGEYESGTFDRYEIGAKMVGEAT